MAEKKEQQPAVEMDRMEYRMRCLEAAIETNHQNPRPNFDPTGLAEQFFKWVSQG